MKGLLDCILLVSLTTGWTQGRHLSSPGSLSFDVLHLNDIHAHFDPINARNGRCRQEEEDCYGGFARLYKAVREIREGNGRKSLLLNAGDYYQGTIWYSLFKYKVVAQFSNMLNYTAMSLGNHEFDGGLEGIEPFIEETQFPVLACNIRDRFTQESKFQRSMIDESLGRRVGIIGYVSTSTPTITNANISSFLEFTDEVECIREEAKALKAQGVDILIALGHSGYEKDLEIAERVPDIDIVVGGHSHTFLYPNGEKPKLNEWIKGDYPTYVTQPSGRIVPVVQAFCFSKYLGQIRLHFDESGELLQPVRGTGVTLAKVRLLDGQEDPFVKDVMRPYQEEMESYYSVVGHTNKDLTRSSTMESLMGNLVTDSMVHAVGRPDVSIAFINSGGIRSNLYKGSITREDVIAVLPFENSIDLVYLKGESLRLILENVASAWKEGTYTTFLQASRGIRMEFYLTENNKQDRIKNMSVNRNGGWDEIQDDKIYKVLVPSFLSNGGMDGPNFDNQALMKERNLAVDTEALFAYIKDFPSLQVEIEGRIKIGGTTGFVTQQNLFI